MHGVPRGQVTAEASPVENYAVIGETHTAALVSRGGFIDWLYLPGFDPGACFAALLGEGATGDGCSLPPLLSRRRLGRYLPGTLVLETRMVNDEGEIRRRPPAERGHGHHPRAPPPRDRREHPPGGRTGGMKADEAKRLRPLETENARVKSCWPGRAGHGHAQGAGGRTGLRPRRRMR